MGLTNLSISRVESANARQNGNARSARVPGLMRFVGRRAGSDCTGCWTLIEFVPRRVHSRCQEFTPDCGAVKYFFFGRFSLGSSAMSEHLMALHFCGFDA